MSDTPETDVALYAMNGVDIVWPEFARKLECQRNQAKYCLKELAEADGQLKVRMAELCDVLWKTEKERDEAREDLEFRRGLYKVQEQHLETARRDSDEARGRERVAIASWDKERKRALREGERVLEAKQERDEARCLLKAAQSALDAIHLEVGGWIKTMKENTD